MSFQDARRVADTVLYEGLVLYPYRATSRKNRFRFQFGVLAPRAFCEAGGGEASSMRVEAPFEGEEARVRVTGRLRFLHLRRRTIEARVGDGFAEADSLEVDGRLHLPWDEAVERESDFALAAGGADRARFSWPEETTYETVRDAAGSVVGRVVRRTSALSAEVFTGIGRHEGVATAVVEVQNVTPYADASPGSPDREGALRVSLVGAHVLLNVDGGSWISLLDPAPFAVRAVAACRNERAFPVLVGRSGDRSTMLGSPIILYDWPAIAPESQGDFFDATEMDGMLTLRTATLTDEEKREVRATDARAAGILARAESIDGQAMQALHGTVRSLRSSADVVARGSRVRVHPGRHQGSGGRTDAQDMFVDGRVAVVEDVREDFEGRTWVAVLMEDDPISEMNRWYGRYLWFKTSEVEALEGAPS